MMPIALLPIVFLALLGHLALCLYCDNHLNAWGLSRGLTKAIGKPIGLFLLAAPAGIACWAVVSGWDARTALAWQAVPWPIALYTLVAALAAVLFLPGWLYRQCTRCSPAILWSNHTQVYDLRPQRGEKLQTAGLGNLFLRLPGNESLRLHVHEKVIELPRLDRALDGLSIAHLSDLHFSGRVGKAWFEEVIGRTNDLQADLIAITGDLVDRSCCLDWIEDTLARLSAPGGVYFVLGNHDLRVDSARLRRMLGSAGLVDLSGRWLQLPVRGQSIVLAGNELPWIRPAADMQTCPAEPPGQRRLRILLSHSPDQIDWARQRDFDLMLAGHTHGGQICFPWIGPILAPSHYGVRYAAGTFHQPPTVMHVSRGLSGLQPIRWNCPPELTKLVLRCGKPG